MAVCTALHSFQGAAHTPSHSQQASSESLPHLHGAGGGGSKTGLRSQGASPWRQPAQHPPRRGELRQPASPGDAASHVRTAHHPWTKPRGVSEDRRSCSLALLSKRSQSHAPKVPDPRLGRLGPGRAVRAHLPARSSMSGSLHSPITVAPSSVLPSPPRTPSPSSPESWQFIPSLPLMI